MTRILDDALSNIIAQTTVLQRREWFECEFRTSVKRRTVIG